MNLYLPIRITPDILLCRDAASALQMVLEKISAARDIVPVSGYRSQWEQTQIYNDSLKESGAEFTKKYVALPGHSEHRQEWRLIWGYIRITLISSVLIFPMTVFAKCSVKRHRAMALLSALSGRERKDYGNRTRTLALPLCWFSALGNYGGQKPHT